jgi:hypothetical protein
VRSEARSRRSAARSTEAAGDERKTEAANELGERGETKAATELGPSPAVVMRPSEGRLRQ